MAKTQEKVQSLYSDIHGAVSGLEVRMKTVTEIANNNVTKISQLEACQGRMASLLDDNKRLVQELQIMQGLVQKVSQQASHNTSQVLDLTARGMEQNLLFHGIDNTLEIEDAKAETPMYSYRERCKYSVLNFLQETMNINLDPEDIWKAHRTGATKPGKVRPIVTKVSYSAKDLIMEKLSVLKGQKNQKTQQTYFISEQIPDGVSENRKQVASRLKVLKEKNEQKPKEERSHLQVTGGKILVNGEVDTPLITTPQPSHLFLSKEAQDRVDVIQTRMIETETETIKNSEFRALALQVSSLQEVQDAYIAVAQRYPSTDHIMLGYALKEQGLKHGFCDDREYGAGLRIKNLIFEQKSRDTAVFVLCKYGGVHLGFSRFAAIESVANKAINMLKAIL